MKLAEGRYVVYERKIVDGRQVEVEVEEAVVLTPGTPFGTTALMALARSWSGMDAGVANQLRDVAVAWAPPVDVSQTA